MEGIGECVKIFGLFKGKVSGIGLLFRIQIYAKKPLNYQDILELFFVKCLLYMIAISKRNKIEM